MDLSAKAQLIHVLLVAAPGEARDACERELVRVGVSYDALDSPADLRGPVAERLYNGLLLDLATWIRCPAQKRSTLQGVIERFPVLRLLYNPEQGGLRGVTLGGTVQQARDMEAFLLEQCAAFPARSFRMAERQSAICNVRILERPDQPEAEGLRAVTSNVSEAGCFLISCRDFAAGQQLWLAFTDFDSHEPIAATVRWLRPWGESMRLPGAGVSFEALNEKQQRALRSLHREPA